MKIIVRVKELRKHHHLTQEELARQLKISRQSLISLEQGKWLPSLPLALQLARFFRAPLDEVIVFLPERSANAGQLKPSVIINRPVKEGKEAQVARELSPWSPFREIREMRDEMERLFDQSGRVTGGALPSVNVRQDEKNIYLEANIPGFNEEQIDIDVADDYVTISGTMTEESKESDQKTGYLRREYQHQSFSRTIGLPLPVHSDKATAKIKHGVLHITLPKVEEEKPKTKRLKPSV